MFFSHVFFFFFLVFCVGVCGGVYAGWETNAEHAAAPACEANVGKAGGRIGSRTQRRVFFFQ